MENIKEFDGKKYREFYGMNDFVKSIGRTLKSVTWGSHGWTKMNKHLLKFKVQARRHKGYIYVAVNGADLFDVWLTNNRGRILKTFNDVFVADIVDTIDKEIEFIEEYSH